MQLIFLFQASLNTDVSKKRKGSSDWFVRTILDVKTTDDGKKMFVLRRSGFSSKHDSWKPESNLSEDLLRNSVHY